MNNYYEITEYTFDEVLNDLCNYDVSPWNIISKFFDIFYTDRGYTNAPVWNGTTAAKPYIENLWELLYARFNRSNCLAIKEGYEDTMEEADKFLLNLFNIVVMTYDRYAAIIAPFEAIKSDLLKKVESSTETDYNDTPQEEGDFTAEEHKTSYTKVTSLIDGATPVDRLNEIQKKLRDIYLDWSNEFKRLFWED